MSHLEYVHVVFYVFNVFHYFVKANTLENVGHSSSNRDNFAHFLFDLDIASYLVICHNIC